MLYHRISGDPDAPHTAFVLHGILGSSQNWRLYIGRLLRRLPNWRFVLIDLRNHGKSGALAGPHTLEACAHDLVEIVGELGTPPEAVIGHSFGGKVALTYARMFPEALEQVWALDILPGASDPEDAVLTSDVIQVIQTLRELDPPIPSRKWLIETLESRGFSRPLARWMTTNLTPLDSGQFGWLFNLDGIDAMLADYLRTDLWPWLEARESPPAIHMVRAANSDRWTPDIIARLQRLEEEGRLHFHTLVDAGHWVHVDNPAGLAEILGAGLESVPKG